MLMQRSNPVAILLAAMLLLVASSPAWAQNPAQPGAAGAPPTGATNPSTPGYPGTGQPLTPPVGPNFRPTWGGNVMSVPPFGQFGPGPWAFGYLGSYDPSLLTFSYLAALAGRAAGWATGISLVEAVAYEAWFYSQYYAHGYGTGRPQVYPNTGMMALIQGSPAPALGAPGAATLRIYAPQDAHVSVNGKALKRSPSQGWYYQSPAIGATGVADVNVRAKWGEGNYEVNRTTDVVLRPGDQKSVLLLQDEAGSP